MNKSEIEEAAKQIFTKNANEGMIEYDEKGFSRAYSTLYKVIISSISEALSQPIEPVKGVNKQQLADIIYWLIPNDIKTAAHAEQVAKSIINELEPYLNTGKQSEAIEFAEWIRKKFDYNDLKCYDDDKEIWTLFKTAFGTKLTSEQLYTEFKNSKGTQYGK